MPRLRPAQHPPKPPGTDERLAKGCYLQDGECLYRVLDVVERQVELENCLVPEGLPQWMPVSEVRDKLKLVRPDDG